MRFFRSSPPSRPFPQTAGGVSLAVLPLPGPPGLPSGSSLGSWNFFKGSIYFQEDEGKALEGLINKDHRGLHQGKGPDKTL